MGEPVELLRVRCRRLVAVAASWSLLGFAKEPSHCWLALAGSSPGSLDSLRAAGAEVIMVEREPAQGLVPGFDQAKRLSDLFPEEANRPLTFPHMPGVPCPDCGWNGETNAD